MPAASTHYEVLYTVLENIHFIYDEHELADVLLAKVSAALNAEAGSIFKRRKDGTLVPLAAYGTALDKLKKLQLREGQGVLGWVAQYGQPVKVDDPKSDERFLVEADARTGFKTRSIVAAPIVSRGKTVGVIEFLNRRGGPFAIQDLELISMVGREVGIAFENVTLVRKIESGRAFLESVLESLSAGLIVTNAEGDIIELNPRAQAILKLKWKAGGDPRSASEVLHDRRSMLEIVHQAVADEAPLSRQERVMDLGGRKRRVGYSTAPIRTKDGRRMGSTVLFQDLTGITA